MEPIANINILPRGEVQRIMWTTKSGEEIAVINMDDEHLTNAYRLCERQKTSIQWWMDTFTDEAQRRGIVLAGNQKSLKMRIRRKRR